jgi:hypothetical protein
LPPIDVAVIAFPPLPFATALIVAYAFESLVAKIAELLELTAFTPTPLCDVPYTPYDDVEVPSTPVPRELVPATPGPVPEFVPATQPDVDEHVTDVIALPIALAAAGESATALAPIARPRPRPALIASGATMAGRSVLRTDNINSLSEGRKVLGP